MSSFLTLQRLAAGPVQILATCLLTLLAGASTLSAQTASPQQVAWAERLQPGETVRVNASLDEGVWERARWTSGLTQKDPVEGPPAAELTEAAFAFDGEHLYIAARLWTPVTGRITTRLSPRDDMGQTQSFFVTLDAFHDRRTSYTFGTTAAGVQVDFHHPMDEELNQVLSWDPVWETRTRIHDDHWVVESRIPFSQLRFSPGHEQVWGLQLDRWSPERNAEDYWVMIPRSETGWASRFGELRGISGITPSRRLELMPYLASDAAFIRNRDFHHPMQDNYLVDLSGRVGGDLKMGLGPNLTLDTTINPDFGQVEADPAEVNLSAFETFFNERRPFFLEGDALLRGNGPRYYYSRRIGSAPQALDLLDTMDFTRLPHHTTILGAAKLTGRLSSGLSVAALAAVTDEEFADYEDRTPVLRQGRVQVQPVARQGVLRLQQDFPDGSLVGLSMTGIERLLDGRPDLAARRPESAYTGGLDGLLRIRDGEYELSGSWGFSQVEGDPQAIAAIQTSSAHYFQRSDADHVHFDPGRERLYGWTGSVNLEREGGEHIRWEVGAQAESPGFELNDLGSLNSADDIDAWGSLNWVENRGRGVFRRSNTWLEPGAAWNFSGVPTSRSVEVGHWGQFQNFWAFDVGIEHVFSALSDNLSRGGELLGSRGGNGAWFSVNSPELQRPNSISFGGSSSWGPEGRLRFNSWFFTRLRPTPQWEFRFNPSWTHDEQPLQYIGKRQTQSGTGIYFAHLDYRETNFATRVRYTPSPRLRFEFYVEPYMASIDYSNPGRARGARSDIVHRFDDGEVTRDPDGSWTLPEQDENGTRITIGRSDFEYSSWRSNLVIRWDWRLGSAFYLVWQQDRGRIQPMSDPDRTPVPFDALSYGGDSLIALKFSYWLPVG